MIVTLAGQAADELLGTMVGYREQSADEIAADELAHDLARQSPRHTELVAEYFDAPPDDVRAFLHGRKTWPERRRWPTSTDARCRAADGRRALAADPCPGRGAAP